MATMVSLYLDDKAEKIVDELTQDGKKVSPTICKIIRNYVHLVNPTNTRDDFTELLRIVVRLNKSAKERGMLFLDELPSEMVEKIKKYKKATEELKKELE